MSSAREEELELGSTGSVAEAREEGGGGGERRAAAAVVPGPTMGPRERRGKQIQVLMQGEVEGGAALGKEAEELSEWKLTGQMRQQSSAAPGRRLAGFVGLPVLGPWGPRCGCTTRGGRPPRPPRTGSAAA